MAEPGALHIQFPITSDCLSSALLVLVCTAQHASEAALEAASESI